MRFASLFLAAILFSAGPAWATNWKVPNKAPPKFDCDAPCHTAFDKCKNKVLASREGLCCTEKQKTDMIKCTSALYQCLKPCQ